jgi:hypothetical protein
MPPAAFSPLGRAHVLLRTLRSPKQLRPCWTSPFEHSPIFPRVGFGHSPKAKYEKYSTAS